jgi:hypothetical protein
MIAVNGSRLDLSKKDDPFVKYYLEKTNFIKSKGTDYVFNFCKNLITPPDPADPRDRPKYPMPFSIRTKQLFSQDNIECEVQYYETALPRKNQETEFLPQSLEIRSSNVFNVKKDLDKIFFLIYISVRCAVMPEFPGQNLNGVSKGSYFELYDRIKSLETEEYEENLEAEVRLALSGGAKGLPIGKIRLLAASYGIRNTADLADVEVRQSLRNIILARKDGVLDNEKVEKFLASFNLDDTIELSASIQLARDNKLIQFVKKSPTNPLAQWRWTEGKVTILETGVGDPEQALKDYFDRYPEQAKKFQEEVKNKMEG